MAPSRVTDIMPQNINENMPQDFIGIKILCGKYGVFFIYCSLNLIKSYNVPFFIFITVIEFEEFVFPSEISIYETYNPGAIVKLWAFTINEKWICLWESSGENILAEMTSNDSRIFAPTIKEIKMPTRIIRIEFNHRNLDYFTEIDGVVLKGVKYTPCGDLQQLMNLTHSNKGPIQRKLEKVSFTTVSALSKHKDHDQLLRDLETFIAKINCNARGLSPTVLPDTDPYTLKNMPVSQ